MVKKRKDKVREKKKKNNDPRHQPSEVSIEATHAVDDLAEATEMRALAMAEELELERQRTETHRKERMARARRGRTGNAMKSVPAGAEIAKSFVFDDDGDSGGLMPLMMPGMMTSNLNASKLPPLRSTGNLNTAESSV